MVSKKCDIKKYLKYHALGVSILLVLITIVLGASSFIAFLEGTQALATLEDSNPYSVTCGPVAKEAPLLGENTENLLVDELTGEPASEDALIAEKELEFDGCTAEFMEAEIIYRINSEAITGRIYMTVIILLVATMLSFALDIAYFSLLRLSTANLFKDELKKQA